MPKNKICFNSVSNLIKEISKRLLALDQVQKKEEESREKELILMLEAMSGPQQSGVASSLAVKMEPFKFDSENKYTFTSWIKTFEEVVGQQENSMLETDKERFLIYNLEIYSYADSILPLQESQLNFEMAKSKLEKLSGDKIPL